MGIRKSLTLPSGYTAYTCCVSRRIHHCFYLNGLSFECWIWMLLKGFFLFLFFLYAWISGCAIYRQIHIGYAWTRAPAFQYPYITQTDYRSILCGVAQLPSLRLKWNCLAHGCVKSLHIHVVLCNHWQSRKGCVKKWVCKFYFQFKPH